jgi:hypothetical protein
MTQTDESGPRHRGRPHNHTEAQGNGRQLDLPTAGALLLPAAGRRSLDAVVVPRCPWCSDSHLHRGLHLDGAVRESGCVPAREYLLAVTR